MPFVSEKQRRYLFAKEPKIAKEFAKHTPKGKKLPLYVEHADLGESTILMDGLEKLQKAYFYSNKKQSEEKSFLNSIRPEKSQSTLNEFGVKGNKYIEK